MSIRVKQNGKWVYLSEVADVDPSLSIEGKAADAKVVGDEIDRLDYYIEQVSESASQTEEQRYRPTMIDFSKWEQGEFEEIVEGIGTIKYNVSFDAEGRPIAIRQDMHRLEVKW